MIDFVLNKIALLTDCFTATRHYKENLNQKSLQSMVNNDLIFLKRGDWICIRNKSAEDILVRTWEVVFDDKIERDIFYGHTDELLRSTGEFYCRYDGSRKVLGYRITFRRTIVGKEANFTVMKLLSDVHEKWESHL